MMNFIISSVIRLIKQFKPALKAYFNRTPGREVPEDFETRRPDQVYTADTDIEIKKDFLTLNKWSRPGKLRKGVRCIEIHWVANPNASAKHTRRWFEMRKGGKYGFGSTQFVVDLDGDIIQMIPEKEIAYSSGAKKYKDGVRQKYGRRPYEYSQSIESTHINWEGKMTPKTYESIIRLCIHLCKKYELTAKNVELHFDLTGKLCHRWFVNNPKYWGEFRDRIDEGLS